MRRILAALFVLIFVGVPVAQWQCAIACAADDAPTVVVCRHASAASTLQAADECGSQETTPVLAPAPKPTAIAALPATSVTMWTTALAPSPTSAPPALTSTGDPPGRIGLPLRI